MEKKSDSARDYEAHAGEFLRRRDRSGSGALVVKGWAESLQSRVSQATDGQKHSDSPSAEVLEIACGGGWPVTRELAAAGLKLWAIDASPTLLETFSSRFPEIETRCESVLDSDFFERQFDGVICVGLLFMLTENEQVSLIRKVAEVLRPGGSFLVSAPLQTGPWIDVLTGTPSLSLGEQRYRGALAKAGFAQVSCRSDRGDNNYYEAIKAGGHGLVMMTGRQLNPRKLLHSKWTAVKPVNREKHFMVTEVEFGEDGEVIHCLLEAVISKRHTTIDWRELKDQERWGQGWK